MREQLAKKYIRGAGIEIGGLHAPLPLPNGANVVYVDRISMDDAPPDVKHLVKLKSVVIDDAEKLENFGEGSLDFVIANHVIEHCHDPIGTLKVWARKLNQGGIAFVACPEKTQTFDRDRKITTLDHIIEDFKLGTYNGRDEEHYREWFSLIDKMKEPELTPHVKMCMEVRTNIHFHVWDNPAMREFLEYIEAQGMLKLIEFVPNGAETIWILRKP